MQRVHDLQQLARDLGLFSLRDSGEGVAVWLCIFRRMRLRYGSHGFGYFRT